MDLKQIKADLDHGMLISRCTRDALLDWAIAARDNALEEAAKWLDEYDGIGMRRAEAIRALRSDSAAIGKPDGAT